MWERVQKFIDRIESRIALWLAIGGSSTMGVITGWLSTGVSWISQFGWFGWWISGLVGALLSALVLMAIAWARYAWVKARTRHKWAEKVDTFNPLEDRFDTVRLSLSDLANPSNNRISRKQFTRCELRGPVNLAFYGAGTMANCGFMNCDVMVVKEGTPIRHAIVMDSCDLYNCTIWECVIYIGPQMVEEFRKMGSSFITLTGVAEIDNQ